MPQQREFHLHHGRRGCALAVRVIPMAHSNEIVEISSDGSLQIRLNAPADEGKINVVLIQFLAGVLGSPPANLEIVAGAGGLSKLISILEIDSETVQKRVSEHLAQRQ